ncbi:hypothetical protein IMZ48_07105 [Candidatus Bathyarchaeota archaeon]|nr:hypothetical protein [Candidatus Bathyarchaeota archaeon]
MHSTMGNPSFAFSAQHSRLLLHLLPFLKDSAQFVAWVGRAPVSAAWHEFVAALPDPNPDPSLDVVTPKVQVALMGTKLPATRFRMLHPDKRDWSAEDHHVRFIVAVISDCLSEELWERKDWSSNPREIVRAVYEVLVYLKTVEGIELGDVPSATDMDG